jgi:hypothetical protein
MIRNLYKVLFLFIGLFAVGYCSEIPSKTNLEVIQSSLDHLADSVVHRSMISSQDTIVFGCRSFTDSWIVRQAFTSYLKNHSFHVIMSGDSFSTGHRIITISNMEVAVRYDSIHREGLFRDKTGKREISTRISFESRHGTTNEIIASDIITDSFTDRIAEDEIQSLENVSVPFTHGELPKESFLDRFAEPFIVVGATGLVVFLFFNVRTQ